MDSPQPDATKENEDDDKVKPILLNVISKCKEEAKENKLCVPLEDIEQRVSYYTGVPQKEVLELLNEKCQNNDEVFKNIILRLKINKCLNTFYALYNYPEYKDVHESLAYKELPDISQFKKNMAAMGYKHKKLIDGKMLLVEDRKLVYERFHCLTKLKTLRTTNAHIYYIDERVISKYWPLHKPSIYAGPPSNSFREFVLFHIISKTGFLTSLFCHQVTDEDFKKWIIDSVLTLLEPSSVIVMDSNPFHGTLKQNKITRYHSKDEMVKWLNARNIPCANMSKAQLYDLIQKYPSKDEDYDIDRILKALGHEVIRLPSHLQAVSATEFMWNYITKMNQNIICKGLNSWKLVRAQVIDWISALPSAQWSEFDIQSHQLVEDILTTDQTMENLLDKYKFDTS